MNIGGNLYVVSLDQTIISGQTVIIKTDFHTTGALLVAGGVASEGNITLGP